MARLSQVGAFLRKIVLIETVGCADGISRRLAGLGGLLGACENDGDNCFSTSCLVIVIITSLMTRQ